MIRIIKKIPRDVTITCSGGIDSMVFTHFLLQGKRKVKLAYFNHDTKHSQKAQTFVEKYANEKNLDLIIGGVKGVKGKRSFEEFWRDERYDFFNSIRSSFIITCHHLDDCVETWLMTSFHGQGKLIPYKRGANIYRPFLITRKKEIEKYAISKDLSWIEDPSNKNTIFTRNYVRHQVMPHVLRVNPGIRKTIFKKLIETYA
jgi:tRNA(Ile)-lysidine synthase|tara:strand:+ start:499 stop:1101 length:603 start_codon:yes stop_codon:yes gene_type:complete